MPKLPVSPEGPFNCHVQFKVTKPMEQRLDEIAGARNTNHNVVLRALIDEEWSRCFRANDNTPPKSSPRRPSPTTAAEADAERADWLRKASPRGLAVELTGLQAERLAWLRRRVGAADDAALIGRWIEEHAASATTGQTWDPTLQGRARHLVDLVRRVDPDSPAGRRLLVHLPHWPETMIAARTLGEALEAATSQTEVTEEALRGAVYRMALDQLEGFADVVGERLAELRRGAVAEPSVGGGQPVPGAGPDGSAQPADELGAEPIGQPVSGAGLELAAAGAAPAPAAAKKWCAGSLESVEVWDPKTKLARCAKCGQEVRARAVDDKSVRIVQWHPATGSAPSHENGSGDTAGITSPQTPSPDAVASTPPGPAEAAPPKPLSPASLKVLDELARGPVVRSEINPGVARLLTERSLAEETEIANPFKTRKGKVRALKITPEGETARTERHAEEDAARAPKPSEPPIGIRARFAGPAIAGTPALSLVATIRAAAAQHRDAIAGEILKLLAAGRASAADLRAALEQAFRKDATSWYGGPLGEKLTDEAFQLLLDQRRIVLADGFYSLFGAERTVAAKLPRLSFDDRLELQALVSAGGAQEPKTPAQSRKWRAMAENGAIAKRAGGALTVRTAAGWKATEYGERVLRAQAGGAG